MSRHPGNVSTISGVVLWLARRAAGLALLTFVGPVAFGLFGMKHQYGHNDFLLLRCFGTGAVMLGGWLCFGAHGTIDRSTEPRDAS